MAVTVTQHQLRKWHERTFPGLDDAERFRRIFGKWQEECRELFDAITGEASREEIGEEMADVWLTLAALAEFGGFKLDKEVTAKFAENLNGRVWVQDGTNEDGSPRWKRERDSRPDLVGKTLPK